MSNNPQGQFPRAIQIPKHRALLRLGVLGLVLAPLLQGCAALMFGGVATGAAVAHDRRDPGTVVQDEQIELSALKLFMENPEFRNHGRISTTSYNNLVLLTGQANKREISDRFARQVARLRNVRKVVNEVTIGPAVSFARETEDALITSRVKVALTRIGMSGFDPTRVKVVTEAGAVYLMGMVHPREGDAAAEKARYVSGVTKVVKLFEYF